MVKDLTGDLHCSTKFRSRETDIPLHTSRGTLIPNAQFHAFSRSEIAQFPTMKRKYPGITLRTTPNPVYNCHGLTFASRRTGIYDSAALHVILHEDGYTEVQSDEVLPGDIILYFSDDGDIEHSGIVVSSPSDEPLSIPRILSKWGRNREVVHAAHNCPYNYPNVRYFRVTKWE